MPKYEMLTGPFIGSVVEEGHSFISHIPFSELDDDMKIRVREFAEDKYGKFLDDDEDYPVPLDQIVEEYELSWESVEVVD